MLQRTALHDLGYQLAGRIENPTAKLFAHLLVPVMADAAANYLEQRGVMQPEEREETIDVDCVIVDEK